METFYTNNKNKEVSNKQEQLENWWVVDNGCSLELGGCALASREGSKEALTAMLKLDSIMNVRVTH